jgi:hypothetical protein
MLAGLKKIEKTATKCATAMSVGTGCALKLTKDLAKSISIPKKIKNIYGNATEGGKIDPDILSKISIIASEYEINKWINNNFNVKVVNENNITSDDLYAKWIGLVNENFLFNFYGRLLIIDYIKKNIELGYRNYNGDEKKLNIIAFLYAQLRGAKDEAQFNRANLFSCWNREDEKWLSEVIFPLSTRQPQITQLLGKAMSGNNPYNTLIGNIAEVIQIASVIKEALKIDSSSIVTVARDFVDPGIINPIILLYKADKIISHLIPGFYSGKEKRRALGVYYECLERYDFLASLIPNDLRDTKENNRITLSLIANRDYKILGDKKYNSIEFKKALIERNLKLEALKNFTNIVYRYYDKLAYSDILIKIHSY